MILRSFATEDDLHLVGSLRATHPTEAIIAMRLYVGRRFMDRTLALAAMRLAMSALLPTSLSLRAHSIVIGNGRVRYIRFSVLIYSATATVHASTAWLTVKSLLATHQIVLAVVVDLTTHFNCSGDRRGTSDRGAAANNAGLRASVLLVHFQNQIINLIN